MSTLSEILKEWTKAYSTLPDEELNKVNAEYATKLGLPTLAALCALSDELERTQRGRALVAEYITPLVQVARGEATERLRTIAGDDKIHCPGGVSAAPKSLLERDWQMVSIDQAVDLCDEWEIERGHSAPMIRAACTRGDLPAELRGKVWYVRVSDLRAWGIQ